MDADVHRTGRDLPMAPGRSRMRAFVQIVGGFVLGLAAAVGRDSGLVLAGHAVGLGALPLCLGPFLPEDPAASAGQYGGRHRLAR